jgi:phosphoglycerol transferase MdoB-like AlkP superfamily enzyme
LLFHFAYGDKLSGGFGHTSMAYLAALRLDLSLAGYLILLPYLFWCFQVAFPEGSWWRINRVVQIILLFFIITILVSNLGLYGSWGTMLNKRLLLYLEKPSEIAHFIDTWKLIALPIVLVGLTWLFYFLWKKLCNFYQSPVRRWTVLLFFPLILLGMRGGWQLVPINESSACYSSHPANNHLAINPVYYFMHSASEYFFLSNKYHFFPSEEAKAILEKELQPEKGSTDTLVNREHPNVVVILLESWTADILSSTGALQGVAPFTDSLIQSSLFFSNAYASGYRTDQGLVSVLSGYPSQPDNTILAYPSKTESLSSISKELKKKNYGTSFFYGGDIEFANMKSYLSQQSYDRISDKNDFDPSEYNSKWGAHDGSVFEKQLQFLENQQEPFFSGLLTLSTHEPFEVPMKTPFDAGSTEHEKFKKAAWYTDYCLREYFRKAGKTKWYANTLFVLVADHGHYLPMQRDMNLPESKRITLFMTGGALHAKQRGRKVEKIVAQHDIVRTLLEALGADYSNFRFSRNMLNDAQGFAFYCNENVSAIITDKGIQQFYFGNSLFEGNESLIPFNKAYLQETYGDFSAR